MRLFYVATNVTFRLNGLTLADGRFVGSNGTSGGTPQPGQDVRGACILSLGGNLVLNSCTLTNCYLQGGDAGTNNSLGSSATAKGGDAMGSAIFCLGGYLNATNCSVIGNTTSAGLGSGVVAQGPGSSTGPGGQALGGAIYSERGSVVLEGVNLAANTVEGGAPGGYGFQGGQDKGGLAAGGGIFASNSTLIVGNSIFANNRVTGGALPSWMVNGLPSGDGLGGALFLSVNSTGMVRSASFKTNSATGGDGGKWFASGGGRGGAIYGAGDLTIFETTLSGNASSGGSQSGYPAPGQGGAVYSAEHLVVDSCTFDQNYALGGGTIGAGGTAWVPGSGEGGAVWSSGFLAATNSTLTANDAIGGVNNYPVGPGPGGPGNGGGIFFFGGTAILVNLTVAANRVDGGTNWVNFGSKGLALGGEVFTTNTSVTVRNSILANSANGPEVWGALTDGGYNLCSDGTAGFSATGSLNQVDPMLSALSQNGGPTPTMALLAGSPARDAIPSGFPPVDQREVTRPQGPAADMGAVEADFISAAAAIITQPLGANVRAGTNVNFVVGASGTAPLSYLWTKNGKPIAGATTSVLFLTNIQSGDAGTYSAIVTNAFGTASSHGAVLVVDSSPLLLSEPTSVVVSPGADTNFTVLADGPALIYQWWHNGAILSGGTSSTLAIVNAMAGAQGNYLVVLSNFAGVATSSTATLNFDSSALSIVVQPKNTSAPVGYPASFSVVASGIPPINYLWLHNGNPLAGQTNNTLTLASVSTNDAGSYSCVVTNGYRSVTSSGAQLTVTPGATPPTLIATRLGNTLTIDFTAEAGRSYRLLSSTNLTSWLSIATNTAVLSGRLEFTQQINSTGEFFKVVTP